MPREERVGRGSLMLYVSPKHLYTPSAGSSGGCKQRSSAGRSRMRGGSFVGVLVSVEEAACEARSLAMRSRFGGVKACQKGGGAGKAAAKGLGAASSSIVPPIACARLSIIREKKIRKFSERATWSCLCCT